MIRNKYRVCWRGKSAVGFQTREGAEEYIAKHPERLRSLLTITVERSTKGKKPGRSA